MEIRVGGLRVVAEAMPDVQTGKRPAANAPKAREYGVGQSWMPEQRVELIESHSMGCAADHERGHFCSTVWRSSSLVVSSRKAEPAAFRTARWISSNPQPNCWPN